MAEARLALKNWHMGLGAEFWPLAPAGGPPSGSFGKMWHQ